MHQSFDPERSNDADAALRHALARDLNLPEQHAAVTATLTAFASIACERAAQSRTSSQSPATPDTWWLLVAHTRALVAR